MFVFKKANIFIVLTLLTYLNMVTFITTEGLNAFFLFYFYHTLNILFSKKKIKITIVNILASFWESAWMIT